MDEDLLETAAYGGIDVHLNFEKEKPSFADLFAICGFEPVGFTPSGKFAFGALSGLGFDQVDDYFGVRSDEEEGDDVKVWLSPLVNGRTVYHHHGPFDGLRLSYGILRNPPENGAFFLRVIAEFAKNLPVEVHYTLRGVNLGSPPQLTLIEADIDEVVAYWRAQGIEPGSEDALMVDF